MPPSPDSRGLGLRSSFLSRPPLGSRALRPGDSLTIPRMALSVSFIRFVSSADATDATELLTPTLVGLTPTEHVSLRWTHYCPKTPPAFTGGVRRPRRQSPLVEQFPSGASSRGCSFARICKPLRNRRPRSASNGQAAGQPAPIFRGRLRSAAVASGLSRRRPRVRVPSTPPPKTRFLTNFARFRA